MIEEIGYLNMSGGEPQQDDLISSKMEKLVKLSIVAANLSKHTNSEAWLQLLGGVAEKDTLLNLIYFSTAHRLKH